jgi:hypothetical protein
VVGCGRVTSGVPPPHCLFNPDCQGHCASPTCTPWTTPSNSRRHAHSEITDLPASVLEVCSGLNGLVPLEEM